MDIVTVRAIADHNNSYGDHYYKVTGDEYSCPADAARSLERDELVKIIAAEEPADGFQTGGRAGNGSGADGAGGDHGKERGTSGAKKSG